MSSLSRSEGCVPKDEVWICHAKWDLVSILYIYIYIYTCLYIYIHVRVIVSDVAGSCVVNALCHCSHMFHGFHVSCHKCLRQMNQIWDEANRPKNKCFWDEDCWSLPHLRWYRQFLNGSSTGPTALSMLCQRKDMRVVKLAMWIYFTGWSLESSYCMCKLYCITLRICADLSKVSFGLKLVSSTSSKFQMLNSDAERIHW